MGPSRMILPDYRQGSIVNLMQSIAAAFGATRHGSPYGPLGIAPAEVIGDGPEMLDITAFDRHQQVADVSDQFDHLFRRDDRR